MDLPAEKDGVAACSQLGPADGTCAAAHTLTAVGRSWPEDSYADSSPVMHPPQHLRLHSLPLVLEEAEAFAEAEASPRMAKREAT